MNVVDSSGWIEFLTDGPNAAVFAKPIEATEELIVPSVGLLEVFKFVPGEKGETPALHVVGEHAPGPGHRSR